MRMKVEVIFHLFMKTQELQKSGCADLLKSQQDWDDHRWKHGDRLLIFFQTKLFTERFKCSRSTGRALSAISTCVIICANKYCMVLLIRPLRSGHIRLPMRGSAGLRTYTCIWDSGRLRNAYIILINWRFCLCLTSQSFNSLFLLSKYQ